MPARFKLHGCEIVVADDESEATIREIVPGSGRKVAGKVLHTVTATQEVTAAAGAIAWAKARKIATQRSDEEKSGDDKPRAPKKLKG